MSLVRNRIKCCVSIHQTDADVIFDGDETKEFRKKVTEIHTFIASMWNFDIFNKKKEKLLQKCPEVKHMIEIGIFIPDSQGVNNPNTIRIYIAGQ